MDQLKREFIINAQDEKVSFALLENEKLVELHEESTSNQYSVGDIFLGRVKKIMPGLNAAFVDIGHEKDAFLHYTNIGSNYRTFSKFTKLAITGSFKKDWTSNFKMEVQTEKEQNISDLITSGDYILVQIIKEPISSKGPSLSADVTIAGRNMVLLPFSDKISVSQKIDTKEEKKRLQNLVKSIIPSNFGVIIRTAAREKKVADLDSELRELISTWEKIPRKLRNIKPPKLLVSEGSKAVTIFRDIFNDSFEKVHVNDRAVFNEIIHSIRTIDPEKEKIVKLFVKEDVSIFDHFGITKQVKSLLGKNITIKYGAYLIIEHTEALHVVDVNSGNRAQSKIPQEEVALTVNMEAAKEIARQLRLRDMGGIIVIDFIDMGNVEHRNQLYNFMKELMEHDKARHTILPLSKFGLMQITRQRFRPEVKIDTSELCPSCNGTGKIEASLAFADRLKSEVLNYADTHSNVRLQVHPFIYAFLTKGIFSERLHWMLKSKTFIKIVPISSYHFLEYEIQ